jgi:hypothetical protein
MASGPPPQSIRPFPFSQKKLECGNRAARINGIVVVGDNVSGLHGCNWASARRHVQERSAQEFFFETDPTLTPYTGPQAKAGSVIIRSTTIP